MSVPSSRLPPTLQSFEIGSGIAGSRMTGSEHNDEFYMDGDRVRTRTNRSGGVQVGRGAHGSSRG
jgi:chorismate synthase